MTGMQKAFIITMLAVAVGTAVYEGHQVSLLRAQTQALLLERDSLSAMLESEREDSASRAAVAQQQGGALAEDETKLVKLRAEAAQLRAELELARLRAAAAARNNDPAMAAMRPLLDGVKKLEEKLGEKPDRIIPEFQFLTVQDWFNAAGKIGKPGTDADFDKAVSALRTSAKTEFAGITQSALRGYAQANNGQAPTEMSQLKPYFGASVDDSVFQRYQLGEGGTVSEVATPQDTQDETYFQIGMNTINSSSRDEDALQAAVEAFSAANNGRTPSDPNQLVPYIKTAAEQAALQKLLQKPGGP